MTQLSPHVLGSSSILDRSSVYSSVCEQTIGPASWKLTRYRPPSSSFSLLPPLAWCAAGCIRKFCATAAFPARSPRRHDGATAAAANSSRIESSLARNGRDFTQPKTRFGWDGSRYSNSHANAKYIGQYQGIKQLLLVAQSL